MTVAMSGRNAL